MQNIGCIRFTIWNDHDIFMYGIQYFFRRKDHVIKYHIPLHNIYHGTSPEHANGWKTQDHCMMTWITFITEQIVYQCACQLAVLLFGCRCQHAFGCKPKKTLTIGNYKTAKT